MISANNRKKALIAGGGIAGLAAAVFLDELGYEITLVEKKPRLGGRTYSFTDRKTGMTIDNGQHLLIGGYHDTFRFLRAIGASARVEKQIPTEIPLADECGIIRSLKLGTFPAPFSLLFAIARFKHFTWRDKIAVMRLGLRVRKLLGADLHPYAKMSVADFLNECGQTQNSINIFWEPFTLATLNDSTAHTSADGLIQVLMGSFFGGRLDPHLVFPKTGLSDVIVNPAVSYLNARGHKVISKTGIKEIRIMDNRCMGFITDDGAALHADLFVSALPGNPLIKVLPKTFLATSPVLSRIDNLASSPIISINLFFDRPVMNQKVIGKCSGNIHWFFCRNLIDTACENSPYHHIVGVKSGAHEWLEKDKTAIVDACVRELAEIFPGASNAQLAHALVNRELAATLSSQPGSNLLRPKQKILDNLYVVGDWTDTGLPATIESAVRSARMMSENVMRADKSG